MDVWTIGLVALLVAGTAVIAYGALYDRRRHRRATAAMLAPPARAIPGFAPDAPAPHYLSDLQARRPPSGAEAAPADGPGTSSASARTLREQQAAPDTVAVRAGYLSADFVTDAATKQAVLDEPLVVVCADPVQTVREVLVALQLAVRTGRPMVLVAPRFAADVRATLEVNVIQRRLRLLAVEADGPAADEIARVTRARPVPRSDLQAGYLPTDVLGGCGRWIAGPSRSHLVARTSIDPDVETDVR